LLTCTTKGEAQLTHAFSAGAIEIQHLVFKEVAKMQPHSINRKQLVLSRILRTEAYASFFSQFVNFPFFRRVAQLSLREIISSFMSTLRRVIS
jgi:hypothetical protein